MLKKEKNFFVLFEMHKYCNLKWKLNDKEIIETNPNRLFFFKYEEWDHTSHYYYHHHHQPFHVCLFPLFVITDGLI